MSFIYGSTGFPALSLASGHAEMENAMRDWITIVSGRKRPPCHPLADPLEGEEWKGHRWIVWLISRFLRGRRA